MENFYLSANPWKEKIHCFEIIGSTNTFALQLGEARAAEGTIVIADQQTQGRGQFQRTWFSPPQTGLWLSLLLRFPINPESIRALSQLGVVALYDALEKCGIPMATITIKEPNDLLLNGKKIAGVLVETRLGASSFAVIGIGLNISQKKMDFPEELQGRVTSLAMAFPQHSLDRQQIAGNLLQALFKRYQQLLHQPEKLDHDWKARLQ